MEGTSAQPQLIGSSATSIFAVTSEFDEAESHARVRQTLQLVGPG